MTKKQISHNLLLVLTLIALNDNQLTPVNGQLNQPNPKCDIKVQHVGPNYIIYQKPIWSISARPFKLPSDTVFNSTVTQLPKVNPDLAGTDNNSLVVPLLKRMNFVENTWYLVCARADERGHCERCDVVLISSCQDMTKYYHNGYSTFLNFTIEKWNSKPIDQNEKPKVNIRISWTPIAANPMPFDYKVINRVEWKPCDSNDTTKTQKRCVTPPPEFDGFPATRVSGRGIAETRTSPYQTISIPENPETHVYTLTVSVDLKIADTVRRYYYGTNNVMPDTYRIGPEPFLMFSHMSGNMTAYHSLKIPFINAYAPITRKNLWKVTIVCKRIATHWERISDFSATVRPGHILLAVLPAITILSKFLLFN